MRTEVRGAILILILAATMGITAGCAHGDKRAVVTYQDAEAILHECLQMQEHLTAQDGALERMIRRLGELETKMGRSAG